MMAHPGKKLLFMGQEFAQISEWNENEELPWDILQYPVHKTTQDYVKALNKLYLTHPALYQKDFHPDGFQWMNCMSSQDNIVSFVRKTDKPEETLLFVCNFAPVAHEKYQLGVPFYGKYKEILNSDSKAFGGSGMGNPRVKTAKEEEYDGQANSLVIDLPPMATVIFSCTPTPAPSRKAAAEKAKKAEAKKPAAKAEAEKKPAAKKSEEKAAAPAKAKAEEPKAAEVKAEGMKAAAPAKAKAEEPKAAEAKAEGKKAAAPAKAKAEKPKAAEAKAETKKPAAKKSSAVKKAVADVKAAVEKKTGKKE